MGVKMRPDEQSVEAAKFRKIRGLVGSKVGQLVSQCIEQHGDQCRSGDLDLPLLTQDGWIPSQPLSLRHVQLELDTAFRTDFTAARDQTFEYWPEVPGNPRPSYSQAVGEYDRPTRWYDGRSFRLTDVLVSAVGNGVESGRQGEVKLCFGPGTYFEAFDTCEPLGYEAAKRHEETAGATISGRYRESLQNPFILHNRCAVPGINTLTIRRHHKDITFYLHQRTDVATAIGTTNVVPAGEFQPSGQRSEPVDAELDLRSTVIREYAEEFLGAEEVLTQRQSEVQVDLSRQYPLLNSAVMQGEAKVYYLGLGLYPLTWKPEILLICIFDGPLFDKVFSKMKEEVYEGRQVGDPSPKRFPYMLAGKKGAHPGVRFDEKTVLSYARNPTTLSAARACLTLAWRHRKFLGIEP
jgi:hypothetical protein